MKCRCGGETSVKDSRLTPDNTMRRRRVCDDCGKRFTTYESTLSPLRVLNDRKVKAERQNRYYHAMDPEKRKIMNKRNRLRHDARQEAKLTGKSVREIYRAWGCE